MGLDFSKSKYLVVFELTTRYILAFSRTRSTMSYTNFNSKDGIASILLSYNSYKISAALVKFTFNQSTYLYMKDEIKN